MHFTGYASLFGIPDAAGDIVLKGAFHRSLATRGAAGIRMLFQHDPSEPLGVWLSLAEDDKGLRVSGRLSTSSSRVRDIAALLAEGALDGLSIGFRTLKAARDRKTGLRQLLHLDLWEISLVTFPMLGNARVTELSRPKTPTP
jgi:Escherichia/Staphylococcus phage prohead protease